MAAPMDDVVGESALEENDTMCLIEATVATGLEQIAKEEAIEVLTKDVKLARGHIILKMPIKDVKKVRFHFQGLLKLLYWTSTNYRHMLHIFLVIFFLLC